MSYAVREKVRDILSNHIRYPEHCAYARFFGNGCPAKNYVHYDRFVIMSTNKQERMGVQFTRESKFSLLSPDGPESEGEEPRRILQNGQ